MTLPGNGGRAAQETKSTTGRSSASATRPRGGRTPASIPSLPHRGPGPRGASMATRCWQIQRCPVR